MPDIYQNNPSLLHPQGAPSHEIEYVDFTDGIKIYLKGFDHPIKGLPQEPAIKAADIVKRMTIEMISLRVLILSPRKALRFWNTVAGKALDFYILKPEYMTPMAKELEKLLTHFVPANTASYIANVIDLDAAYRLRIQDLFTESSKERLLHQPIRELWRLLEINKKREGQTFVHSKFRTFAKIATISLLIPRYRKAFRNAILDCDYTKLILDESDAFWLAQRHDYRQSQPV